MDKFVILLFFFSSSILSFSQEVENKEKIRFSLLVHKKFKKTELFDKSFTKRRAMDVTFVSKEIKKSGVKYIGGFGLINNEFNLEIPLLNKNEKLAIPAQYFYFANGVSLTRLGDLELTFNIGQIYRSIVIEHEDGGAFYQKNGFISSVNMGYIVPTYKERRFGEPTRRLHSMFYGITARAYTIKGSYIPKENEHLHGNVSLNLMGFDLFFKVGYVFGNN